MIIDIEKCPIATPIINAGLHIERQKAAERLNQNPSLRRKGATILIRESTQRTTTGTSIPTSPSSTDQDPDLSSTTPLSVDLKTTKSNTPSLLITYPTHTDIKTYTSEHKALVTEYVNNFTFQTVANSFFQNNSSILPPFIAYVRQHCLPKSPGPTDPPVKYLLDAYCGSGLFAVCLSPLFNSVLGIDIDVAGVNAARANAEANGIPNAGFIAAEAEMIFADVPFPPDQSLVVIDPPRKGASVDFLTQLCRFGPKRVVYVSCNVHTQARDVGMLVQGVGEKWRYEIERLRGFDFFPQTGHVEGVCVLKRVEDERDGVVAGGREVEVETGKIFGATSAEELVEGGAEEKEIEEHGVGKLPGKREGWDENADPNASDKRDENGNTAV
jgi:tRNA (uracil-5-)-methyltransferase